MPYRVGWRCVVPLLCLALLLVACQMPQPVRDAAHTPKAKLAEPQPLPTIPPPGDVAPAPTHTPSTGPVRPATGNGGLAPRPEWESYSAHGDVRALASHPDGSIWGITSGGVVRWDVVSGEAQAFGSPDGLASQAVHALWIAHDGQVWAGTEAGLARYDGASWVTFTKEQGLPSDRVFSLTQTADRTLWAGTDLGLARLYGDRWQTVWTAPEGSAGRAVATLETRDGILWFAIQGHGLGRYDGAAWTLLTSEDGAPTMPTALMEDAQGALWVGTANQGILRYVEGTWTEFAQVRGLPIGPISDLMEDLEGTIWAGGADGLARYDGRDWTSVDDLALANVAVHDLALGLDGHLWAATDRGLSHYDGSVWEHLGPGEGLPSAPVYSLLPDQFRGLYVGAAGGLAAYFEQQWTVLDGPQGPPGHQVLDMVQTDDGLFWMATGDAGLLVYDGARWEQFDPWAAQANAAPDVQRLFDLGDGSLWLSGGHGVAQIDPATRQVLYRSRCLPEGLQRPLLARRDGEVWFADASGLVVHRRSDLSWGEAALGPQGDPVTALAMLEAADGVLWVGTDGAGLFRRDGDGAFARIRALGNVTVRSLAQDAQGIVWAATPRGLRRWDGSYWQLWTGAQGLGNSDVRTLVVDGEGALWAGTVGGLGRLTGDDWDWHTTAQGLPDDVITALAVGPDGALWAGTGRGVARRDGEDWVTVATDSITAALAAADGSLWFGTPQGLLRHDGLAGYELYSGGLAGVPVTSLLQDADGALWAETAEGVAWFADGNWATVTQCGPGMTGPLEMLHDRQGNLWVLSGEGVYRHSQGLWERWGVADGLSMTAPLTIMEDHQGRIWYVGADIVAHYQDGRWTPATVQTDDEEPIMLRALAETDDGRLWLATDGGLFRLEGDRFAAVGPDAARSPLTGLAPAPGGALWAVGDQGLLHNDGEGWQVYARGQELPDAPVSDVLVATDGTLWVGVEGYGLLHHNAQGWRSIQSLHGLASNAVTRLYEAPDGALWFATRRGLSRHTPAP